MFGGRSYFSWILRKGLSEAVTSEGFTVHWLNPQFTSLPSRGGHVQGLANKMSVGVGRWRGCPGEAFASLKRKPSTLAQSFSGPPAPPLTVRGREDTAERQVRNQH